jgi:hypothetical protein
MIYKTIPGQTTTDYEIGNLKHLDQAATRYIEKMDILYPDCEGITIDQVMAYSQAQAKSAFYGVNSYKNSSKAVEGMYSTLITHYNTEAHRRDNI